MSGVQQDLARVDGRTPHEVRSLPEDRLRDASAVFTDALLMARMSEEQWAVQRSGYEPGRTLGVDDGTGLIGTATAFSTRAVVPGGAAVAAAGVTRVGVRADRTRRGVVSALMRTQLRDVAERGEVLASLRATEARIYGRFGYGVATRGRAVALTQNAGWRAGAPTGGGVRLVPRGDAVATLAGVHERIALQRPGGITRPAGWWTRLTRSLAGEDPFVLAVHTGAGGDDGFAVARVAPGSGGRFDERTLSVEDLHAAGPDATAGLWRFLLGIDLAHRVEAGLRPLDEDLDLLLADPRDAEYRSTGDETWLRIVDLPAAVAARSWTAAEPVTVAVHDALLPANTGVYRLGSGAAEPVGTAAQEADLECDTAAFAMAYLGDRAPSQLVAAGWWRARDAGAPARADAVFATGAPPWSGTFF